MTILVANKDYAEAQGIIAALEPRFMGQPVADTAQLIGALPTATGIVLDTNFSSEQGMDTLMEVLARKHIPVLMITPLEDSLCAVEALRCGAAAYIVKTGAYGALVPMALQEALQRNASLAELRQEITQLRNRVNELEAQLAAQPAATAAGAATQASPPSATSASAPGSPAKKPGLLIDIVNRLRSGEVTLPAYSQVASRLRQLIEQDASVKDVAFSLSQDAAISARLLQIANSARYANARTAVSIEDAINRIGLADTAHVVELVANQSLYVVRNSAYQPFFKALWRHSMACAHACSALGRYVEKATLPKLFSLGLLHDAGKLMLLQSIAQLDPTGERINTPESVAKLHEFLNTHHASFGTQLLQRWKFDDDFIDAARYHDDLSGTTQYSRQLLIVHLANLLVRSLGYGEPLDTPDQLERSVSRAFFAIDADRMKAIGIEVEEAIHHAEELFH